MSTPGVSTLATYEPTEIRGPGNASQFLTLPCTVEEGQDLEAGQVIGVRPTSELYIAYDKDAAASATSPEPGDGNVGAGSCSAIAVQDDYTLTENWTLTCTAESSNAGTFSVVGSVSGNVGNATVGVEFKSPNTTAYAIKFTISDSGEDFDIGDTFTFSTTAAGAQVAKGILTENVDATDGDQVSSMYVRGNFTTVELTDLDTDAMVNLNGKTANEYFLM